MPFKTPLADLMRPKKLSQMGWSTRIVKSWTTLATDY